MAYMSQDKKKELTPAIKAVLKKFGMKGSLAVRHHSVLVANIKSGAIDFNLGERDYRQINEYHIESRYKGKALEFLLALKATMMLGNHNNSDLTTDYFDVGWYIEINIGQWDKPYLKS